MDPPSTSGHRPPSRLPGARERLARRQWGPVACRSARPGPEARAERDERRGRFRCVVADVRADPVQRILVDVSRPDLRDPEKGRPVRIYDWTPRTPEHAP